MGDDEFQRELRPTFCADIAGPARQGLVLEPAQQTAAAERTIAQHRDTAFFRQWQNAFFGVAIVERVVDLQKIELFGFQRRFHGVVGGRCVVRDADVADLSLLFPLAQRRQIRAPIDEVVDLHQIDAIGAQQSKRIFHLRDAGLLSLRPHFRRDKCFRSQIAHGEQFAGGFFRAAVHRRTVDDAAARREQRVEHARQFAVLG